VTDDILDLAAPLPVVLHLSTDGVSTQYVYAGGTRPLAQYADGAWTYFLPDGLGSVRQEVNVAGEVQAVRSFDPYGNVLDGDGGTPFGYTGEQYDAYTELMFLRARYMQPKLGMFLSRDPWEGNPSRPNTLHAFSYAANNPKCVT
jgi:RHS repeat-associated protein